MHIQRFAPKLAVLATLTLAVITTPAAAQDLRWMRQFGTPAEDRGFGVAVDSAGNAYITGYTEGSLGGPNAGSLDYFLAKYDPSGAVLWTRQVGTSADEHGYGVAVDSAGNAYITGYTSGSLDGPNAGGGDVFLAKFGASGVLLWTRQIGTRLWDYGFGVAVDSAGSAYITGQTQGSLGGPSAGHWDAFVARYDADGTQLWIRQFGTSSADIGKGVAVDGAGNVYITGQTGGSLGGPRAGDWDVFLAKYDPSGAVLWTRQVGTSDYDTGLGVAVDSAGSAYITGWTEGSLFGPNAGGADYFLAKYDASGTQLWTRQIGTSSTEIGKGVAVDSAGNAFITGYTSGSLGGPNAGSNDIFLAKYDASGVLLWTRQTGRPSAEGASGVAVNDVGTAYIIGTTDGSLGGFNAGESDVFLAKYEAPCYADCDMSTGIGVLDIFDFLCFQNSFVNSEPYACDCDTSTGLGICDVFDFLCFQNAFAGGCP